MNLNTIIIVLLSILIILYIIDMTNPDTFKNLVDDFNYGNVNYNTRMQDGVETVIPSVKNVCKDKQVDMNNDNVRNRYLAKNIKLNQTIPKPNNIKNINNMIDSNTNDQKRYDNNLYDNLTDIKSLNSMISNNEFNELNEINEYNTLNDVDDELLTLN
jgi:hypothetical protein